MLSSPALSRVASHNHTCCFVAHGKRGGGTGRGEGRRGGGGEVGGLGVTG